MYIWNIRTLGISHLQPKVWHALLLFPQIYKNLCERLTNEIICHDPRSDDRNRDARYLSTFKKCPDGRDICLPVFDGKVVPVLTQGFLPTESGLWDKQTWFSIYQFLETAGKSYMRILRSSQFNLILWFPAIRVCIRSPLHYNRFLIVWDMFSWLSVQAGLKRPHCLRVLYPPCFHVFCFF